MGAPAKRPTSNLTAPARKPVPAKEKAKPIAYVNWDIINPETGESQLRSNRGFSLFDNEYLTREEKALIDLAKANGDSVTVTAELRIIVAQDRPDTLDISGITIKPKA